MVLPADNAHSSSKNWSDSMTKTPTGQVPLSVLRGGVTVNLSSVTSVIGNELKMRAFIAQDYSLLAIQSVRNISATRRYFADLVEQMDVIGVGSLRIVVVALLCVGGVVVLNSASQFRRFGETVLTADAVSLALLRELGPVFTVMCRSIWPTSNARG
jgi:ABC-type transporter Mla maintaining outer membrane lipid asymmetry permease subunit MlaE